MNITGISIWQTGKTQVAAQKQTVEAGRRRHTGDEPAGGRPRAEAPQRRTSDGSSGSSSGGQRPVFPSSGGGALRPGKPLSLGAVLLIIICIVAYTLITGGESDQIDNSGEEIFATQAPAQPVSQAELATQTAQRLTNTPRPTSAPRPTTVGGTANQTWLVMLYQDADDKVLEQDIFIDLNEAERAGSTDQVQIVAQFDRFKGAFNGDGNWTSARRYFITRDSDLNHINSQEVADLGEVNMSSGQTLVDFVTWAARTYPADKYVLVLSDHGMGWPGGWSDPDPGGRGDPNIPLESRLGDELYLNELDQALGQARQQAGIDQFELIGLDACLMSHIEVYAALAEHARYAVASQETEPSLGWAYTGFLDVLTQNPSMNGAELAGAIVNSYIDQDQRITDNQARQDYLRQGSPRGGMFSISAQQLTQQIEKNATLTAVDLTTIPQLMQGLNDLTLTMQDANQQEVARARSYAQSFTSIFGNDVPASYIDLGHFAQLLNGYTSNRNVKTAISNLLAALGQTVIAEKHGSQKPAATGISIYFPNSALYRNPVTGAESYTQIADRFASESLWDDFLDYHYTGQEFTFDTGTAAIPGPGSRVQGPGTGKIQVSPLSLSSDRAAPGNPVTLSADITGSNIGHIYLFVGYFDSAANSIYVADMDYLESSDTRQLNGVYYPVWPENAFTLTFDWDPIVFAVSNGQDWVSAVFNPQSYGATWEDAIYTVDGIYTFADSGDQRYARLLFSNGELRQVFGFTGSDNPEDATGAPSEITPQSGDTFTVLEKWLDLAPDGSVAKTSYQQGKTLTFGDQMFEWKELTAVVGRYIVGFLVEDLDGNIVPVYAEVNVE
jgi:hypothetical protein